MASRWTPEEDARRRGLEADGLSPEAIASALGRTPYGVMNRQWKERAAANRRRPVGAGQVKDPPMPKRPPEGRLRDLTAALMGDPPIGRSALDERR